MRITWLLVSTWLLLAPAGADGAVPVHATITDTRAQTLRGWGMSLAWEANDVYGSALMPAGLPTVAARRQYMDLLYGNPASGAGLGLNVARYNIGGGGDPDRGHCSNPGHGLRPDAEMEGFLRPDGSYDWSRDASQRRMLHEALARGADIVEAFSNSAPWWMTVSGCVSGAARGGENNLRADAVPAFARYLATVAAHFARDEKVSFASISPVNEPDGDWWKLGNNQEGSFADLPMQQAIITALARDLAGTGIVVSGTEPNNLDVMTRYLAAMDAPTLAALGRINVHQYDGHDPAALHRAATRLGKPLWASEVGCCFDRTHSEMAGALVIASSIQSAMRELQASVWCFWQPDWGVIAFRSGHPQPLKQFYAIAQYTRFIRPGFSILASGGDNLLAALSPDGRRLVLVAINSGGSETNEDVDLTAFHRPGATIAVYRTTADPLVDLASATERVDTAGHLSDRLPAGSVTTYVIDGTPATISRPR